MSPKEKKLKKSQLKTANKKIDDTVKQFLKNDSLVNNTKKVSQQEPEGKLKRMGRSYDIENSYQEVKKVMNEESDFLTERKFSGDKLDAWTLAENVDKKPIDTKRKFIEKEAKSFDINVKKYKLWSFTNVSKNNEFLSIVAPLINNDLEIPKALGKFEIEELKNLLEFKFAIIFREYIKDSKLVKLKLESRFDEVTRKQEKDYANLRNKVEYEHNGELEILQKGLATIDEELKVLNERLNIVNKDVKDEINLTKKKKDLLLLINDRDRNPTNAVDKIVKQADDREVASWENEINKINKQIDVLSVKKNKIIERINKEKLNFTNKIDGEFIEKQKTITRLEVDKIEILIFLRENLIALNRAIRDIKIQIGIKHIEANNKRSEQIFDDIDEALNRTKKQFELLDDVNSTDNKIKVEKTIDTSTRIVNLKTGESY